MTGHAPTARPIGETFSERAHRLIPGGAHTYSRGDDQLPSNAPRAFVRAKGARAWDITGNEYVDWGMGINNVLIGHAEDEIDEAAIRALRDGQAFSRPSPLEVDLAEDLLALFPAMDMAKFAKNGSDANTAAIRLARAVTGRDLIAYDADAPFLSIHDWFIGRTEMDAGVPRAVRDLSVPFRSSDPASVDRLFEEHRGRLAAVVLEVCRDVRPVPGLLERLRRLCDRDGTVLVFDEVVTAFRYHLHGAQALFGVTPDLTSVGKGMANGYALSALLGRRELMERGGLRHMEERVFLLSTTNGPERSALAAGRAVIDFYRRHDVIGQLHRTGARLLAAAREAAARHGVERYVVARSDFDCRPMIHFLDGGGAASAELRTLFLQELVARGVFMPWICPSFRHGELELEQTAEALDAACAVYARATEQGSTEGLLAGPPARPVFRRWNDGPA